VVDHTAEGISRFAEISFRVLYRDIATQMYEIGYKYPRKSDHSRAQTKRLGDRAFSEKRNLLQPIFVMYMVNDKKAD
jgi:hypothetical protein